MAQTVPVRVAGELVISIDDLPIEAFDQIKAALTVANEEREKQLELKTFGAWDLPETIALYRIEARRGGDQVICLPRGFSSQLAVGLHGLGLQVAWEDHRKHAEAAPDYYRLFNLRNYQLTAIADIVRAQQGILRAPAGSGKTTIMLGAFAMTNQRALVIVDKAGLVEQWRARAARFYGFPLEKDEDGHDVAPLEGVRTAGKIGQGIWEERDLTICLRQTLHERSWQMDATGWWESWGAVTFDEGHHLSAETLGDICRKVTSFYLWSASATPFKSVMKGAIVRALVGPIVHDVPRDILYEQGVLMKPLVEVLEGDFHAHFHPDHDSDGEGNCEAHGCRKTGKHRHRNNYSSVLKKLVEDPKRNQRVAARVVADRGHVHLLPSRQLKHLKLLREALVDAGWPEDRIWMLRGEENARGEDQKIVQQVMDADEGVILSTVAEEALDIPPIDRVHISFPMRDSGSTVQLVGRGERVHPGKTDAIVIDYREPKVDVLENQWMERRSTYDMQGYDVVMSEHSLEQEAEVA